MAKATQPCAAGILEALRHFGNSSDVATGASAQMDAPEVNRLCETAKKLWGALHTCLLDDVPTADRRSRAGGHGAVDGALRHPYNLLG
jgi:hypothetical protein